MAVKRTREEKENPHYRFLYSWEGKPAGADSKTPLQARVKGKAKIEAKSDLALISVKKDIARSLILVSFILIMELVVYLAWNKFILS
ncbi:MAG: hypothetical protein UX13_C0050G0008 [Candidatus Woesebacteria bacterium GW2011_GWB1_45_5]|uniref:Uncharacterized protein n=1 Tax=Candidatus Woesebacteria bacterium GW2011_GWB1_45_5 TaxID=1618581 RepID=A0A0G1PUA6_9BACT|nr:MAG: hypothetical protein UX13_C0050G0008 [Candidatus Woesebacteria bacterium GW2011_GWB1_45_5]